jgi:nucleotide-binding universal stress UspA family protein
MYRNVLLAYDGTFEGRAALREGALLAKRCNAQVVLLAVVDTVAYAAVGMDMAYVPPDPTPNYQKILDEGVARLTRMGLRHTARLLHGDPVACIVEVAREVGADLVVVGHHKRGFLARWLRGSVTASLIDLLDCSVLMGRREVSEEELFA